MQATLTALAECAPGMPSEGRTGKYLTFLIGKVEFGIGVQNVREIMGIQEITAVPHTPAHLKGVINLRGKVVPVIDLHLKFGLPCVAYASRTCIVVVQVKGVHAPLLMGIVVDEVSEVSAIDASDIEDAPRFGTRIASSYLLGIAKSKGKVKLLLDIEEVLGSHEIHGLEAVIQER